MSVCARLLESILQLQNTFELTSYPPKAVFKVCIVKVLPSYYFLSSQTSVQASKRALLQLF